MDKYDTDIEAIDLKIQIQRNKYSATKEKRINFEQTVSIYLPIYNKKNMNYQLCWMNLYNW